MTIDTSVEFIVGNFTKSYITYISTKKPEFLNANWKFNSLGIGGLDKEFSVIFRRAFISRCLPLKLVKELNIKHVRGILLYGPSGTGKTLIANRISDLLKSVKPIIINGPEIMNSYVGKSEENIRNIFAAAKKEWNDKKEKSELHVIIFDEIDAICKSRGSVSSGVYDAIVNQLLTEMDGINTPNNFLVIGMTNRKDLLDPALLRPGLFEVHVEINLADKEGRHEILEIHTKVLKENKRLGQDVDLLEIASRTKNYSGAELEGLISCAKTFALSDTVKDDKDKIITNSERNKKFNSVTVTMQHFKMALQEVKPLFGACHEDLLLRIPHDIIMFNETMKNLYNEILNLIVKFKNENSQANTFSILLYGQSGSGKSALASKFAIESQYPYIKIIVPENYIGYTEQMKCLSIAKVFDDAYKTPSSIIIIDDIEQLLEYVAIGPRFSNHVLQRLTTLINKIHPVVSRRLLVIGTTNNLDLLNELQLIRSFNTQYLLPNLLYKQDIKNVLNNLLDDDDNDNKISRKIFDTICKNLVIEDGLIKDEISIKTLLTKIIIAKRLL